MRRVMLVTAVISTCLMVLCVAQANLLLNSDFESGPGDGSAAPDNWWRSSADSGSQDWAARNGSLGVGFYPWANGSSYTLQDVSVNLANGNVFEWSIWGLAEADYTVGMTYLGMEFWGSGSLKYAVTNDISSAINGDRNNWNQYTFIHTNEDNTVDMVKPMFGFLNGTDVGGTQGGKWDDASFTQSVIPEPTTMALLGVAMGVAVVLRRRQRR